MPDGRGKYYIYNCTKKKNWEKCDEQLKIIDARERNREKKKKKLVVVGSSPVRVQSPLSVGFLGWDRRSSFASFPASRFPRCFPSFRASLTPSPGAAPSHPVSRGTRLTASPAQGFSFVYFISFLVLFIFFFFKLLLYLALLLLFPLRFISKPKRWHIAKANTPEMHDSTN